jgi:hypothetical protein
MVKVVVVVVAVVVVVVAVVVVVVVSARHVMKTICTYLARTETTSDEDGERDVEDPESSSELWKLRCCVDHGAKTGSMGKMGEIVMAVSADKPQPQDRLN